MHSSAEPAASARKVLDILHPFAPWSRDPLDATVPLSALVAIVRSSLAENPFFPPDASPGTLGDGAVIERRSKRLFVVHERSEIGQLRYSSLSSHSYLLLRSAVQRYLRHYRYVLRAKGVRIQRWA